MIAVRFALANDVCDSLVRRAYFCFDQKAEKKKNFPVHRDFSEIFFNLLLAALLAEFSCAYNSYLSLIIYNL